MGTTNSSSRRLKSFAASALFAYALGGFGVGCGGSTSPEGRGAGANSSARARRTPLAAEPSAANEPTDDSVEAMVGIESDVQSLFERKQGSVVHCFIERTRVRNDLIKGEFLVEGTVQKQRAKSVSVTGRNIKDSEIESCIRDSVASWTFPESSVAYPVSYVYSFEKL